MSEEEKVEVLVVASKVKNYIKTNSELSKSAEVYNVLSQKVRELCDQAIESAKNAKRKTVMAKDF
jgi:histone H3/H4